MAVGPNVGNVNIGVNVRAENVAEQIQRGMGNPNKIGRRYGESMGQAFSRGFNRFADRNTLSRISEGLKTAVPGAERARRAWAGLMRMSYTLQTAISSLIGGLGSLVGGLGALVGAAGGAAASLVVIGNGAFAMVAGLIAARLALSGVGRALSALSRQSGGSASSLANNAKQVEAAERNLARVIETNRENLLEANNAVREAQIALNEAFAAGREEIQQIGFEAENAALDEQRAALELEKAREALARVQDLPPNSRARKEAELAFQEAELNLRMAKDKSADLNKEQDRLARTGVAGTEAVIDATNNLAEAEANKARVVRDALRSQADAEQDLADAKKKSEAGGGGGGADPLAGLNEYQKNFVKFLMSLKPLYEELKLTASAAFLPPLQQAIQLLADKAFPTINKGIGQVAGAMGSAAVSLALAITNAENLGDLQRVFAGAAYTIESLGRSMGNIWDAVMSLMSAATPLTKRFVDFIEKKTGIFARFLDTKEATGELEKFFKRSGDIMADFGKIFGNIFKGLGQLIRANFGPGSGGDYLVQWLKSATDKFANLDRLAGGQKNLENYFKGASTNAQKLLSSIGALLTQIIKLGDNKDIGRTFDILAQGAPALGRILEKSLEAGPALAALVVTLTEIGDKLTDTSSMEIFFNILNTFATAINDLLKNEAIMAIVEFASQIGALALAFGLVYKLGNFAFKAISGSLIAITGIAGKATGAMTMLGNALFATGTKGQAARGAIAGIGKGVLRAGGWMAIFAGVSGAMSALSDEGRITESAMKSVDGAIRGIGNLSINDTFDTIAVSTLGANTELGALSRNLQDSVGPWHQFQKSLAGAMDAVSFGMTNASAGFQAFDGTVRQMSSTLGNIAQVNLNQAATSFKNMTAGSNMSKEELIKLLGTMPEYRNQLIELANANGLATDDQSLLNLALGQGAGAAGIIAAQFRDGSAAALDTSGKVQGLADKIRDFTSATSDAINTEINYEQSLDDLTASLTANGTTFDITTQAGRDNTRALQDLAAASSEAAAAAYEQDGDVAKLTATMDANRQEMINTMVQSGMTEEAAKGMVDQFMMTPEQIQTEVKTKGIPESKQDLEDVQKKVKDVPDKKTVKMNVETGNGWVDFWGKVDNFMNFKGFTLAPRRGANGMFNSYANGGLMAFANGGMMGTTGAGIYKGRPGGLYKFAEPETGWEAFISGKPGQERRNIEIWKEAGRRLGVLVGENSNGGLYGVAKAMSKTNEALETKQSTNINSISITVNPSPGMDERELASAVSRELAFQMRKGAVA